MTFNLSLILFLWCCILGIQWLCRLKACIATYYYMKIYPYFYTNDNISFSKVFKYKLNTSRIAWVKSNIKRSLRSEWTQTWQQTTWEVAMVSIVCYLSIYAQNIGDMWFNGEIQVSDLHSILFCKEMSLIFLNEQDAGFIY